MDGNNKLGMYEVMNRRSKGGMGIIRMLEFTISAQYNNKKRSTGPGLFSLQIIYIPLWTPSTSLLTPVPPSPVWVWAPLLPSAHPQHHLPSKRSRSNLQCVRPPHPS